MHSQKDINIIQNQQKNKDQKTTSSTSNLLNQGFLPQSSFNLMKKSQLNNDFSKLQIGNRNNQNLQKEQVQSFENARLNQNNSSKTAHYINLYESQKKIKKDKKLPLQDNLDQIQNVKVKKLTKETYIKILEYANLPIQKLIQLNLFNKKFHNEILPLFLIQSTFNSSLRNNVSFLLNDKFFELQNPADDYKFDPKIGKIPIIRIDKLQPLFSLKDLQDQMKKLQKSQLRDTIYILLKKCNSAFLNSIRIMQIKRNQYMLNISNNYVAVNLVYDFDSKAYKIEQIELIENRQADQFVSVCNKNGDLIQSFYFLNDKTLFQQSHMLEQMQIVNFIDNKWEVQSNLVQKYISPQENIAQFRILQYKLNESQSINVSLFKKCWDLNQKQIMIKSNKFVDSCQISILLIEDYLNSKKDVKKSIFLDFKDKYVFEKNFQSFLAIHVFQDKLFLELAQKEKLFNNRLYLIFQLQRENNKIIDIDKNYKIVNIFSNENGDERSRSFDFDGKHIIIKSLIAQQDVQDWPKFKNLFLKEIYVSNDFNNFDVFEKIYQVQV